MKKFELTSETKINIFGKKLFRIKALISFGDVEAGETGGWVEKEGNVNEEWLRTGNGDMFVPGIKDKQISAMLADVMKSGEDSFRHRLVSALARLDDEGWDNLEKLIDMIANK